MPPEAFLIPIIRRVRSLSCCTPEGETEVYPDLEQAENPIFVLTEKDNILLVTEYHRETDTVKAWFIGDDVLFSGYVSSRSLKDEILADDEVDAYADLYLWDWAETEAGTLYAFAAAGYAIMEESADTGFTDYEKWADETDDFESPEDDESLTEDKLEEEIPVVKPMKMSAVRSVSFMTASAASSFTGSETVRLGKESSNINGILLQNNRASSWEYSAPPCFPRNPDRR